MWFTILISRSTTVAAIFGVQVYLFIFTSTIKISLFPFVAGTEKEAMPSSEN